MVDDHTGAGDKLRTVASQHQIETAAQIDDKHRDLRDKLASKQGLDFDKDYMDAMVDGHNDLLDKLESRIDKDTLSKFKASYVGKDTAKVEATAVTAEKSDDPIKMAVNEWAAQTYPVAYAHREAAKTLRDAVKKRTTN
jgi:putative membrane protein